MQTFEEYLKDQCFELHNEVLFYDKPSFFMLWLGEQDSESLLIYSEGWGRHIKSHILREVTKITN